jgi:hypothetical protein
MAFIGVDYQRAGRGLFFFLLDTGLWAMDSGGAQAILWRFIFESCQYCSFF